VSYAKKEAAMKPMFIAFFAIVVIAIGASFGLGMLPFSLTGLFRLARAVLNTP